MNKVMECPFFTLAALPAYGLGTAHGCYARVWVQYQQSVAIIRHENGQYREIVFLRTV